MKPQNSCQCNNCKDACQRPGWFVPGEIEQVAEFLNISIEELFRTKLIVDWWEEDSKQNTFVLCPGIKDRPFGTMAPHNPHGECIFFNNKGLCEIHPVKPFECAKYSCKSRKSFHEEAKKKWENKTAQKQIRKLLGEEPEAEEGSSLDLLLF